MQKTTKKIEKNNKKTRKKSCFFDIFMIMQPNFCNLKSNNCLCR